MSPHVQTTVALAVVALAIGALVWRSLARRGSGHGCASCPPDKFKAKLK